MYAIVRAGGRQVRVEPRQTVKVDRLPDPVGDGVEFGEVLALHDGTTLTVGTPCVANAKVLGRIVAQERGPKLRVRTYRKKKRTRKRRGHRQDHTLVQILGIEAEQLRNAAEPAAVADPDAE
jgi:large subunit ribosomal protein L21